MANELNPILKNIDYGAGLYSGDFKSVQDFRRQRRNKRKKKIIHLLKGKTK